MRSTVKPWLGRVFVVAVEEVVSDQGRDRAALRLADQLRPVVVERERAGVDLVGDPLR